MTIRKVCLLLSAGSLLVAVAVAGGAYALRPSGWPLGICAIVVLALLALSVDALISGLIKADSKELIGENALFEIVDLLLT